ncbi:hypothetical protein PR202_gb06385 [Eleusine coracana subsp. coracana]|uniref:glucose-6-phosphate 1-epimerase n=1 Tax=Eleusine coracana subsp. coracana TaxID=191504 RepID=A0AAV5E8P9_ELECO|nr:hypothetical protein PR202_gb06385 [Eleusine coracana subsp. coracana]
MAETASVERVKDRATGLEKFVLREARGSSVEKHQVSSVSILLKWYQVYLYGGQVTSWKSNSGQQLLFVSHKAHFKPPKAIRGGIQICFPQVWSSGFHGQLMFPVKCYEFRLRVALSPRGDLILTSRIRNTSSDGKPFQFTFAYHTYFSVSDISEVRVEGLETLDYFDHLQSKIRCTEQGDAVVFESEKVVIIDHEKKRTFVLRKDGLPDVVVWNPWDKKAKAMPDFGDEDYKNMLCVGAAAIEKPITLKPGEEWQGRQEISAVPSSYSSGQLDPEVIRRMHTI